MENWRQFFQGSGVDLWTVCERALTLAYLDGAEDFPAKRDRLAQKLFAPEKLDFHVCEFDAPQLSGSKRGFGRDDLAKREGASVEERIPTPCRAYHEAEALTEELEEGIMSKRDVLDIKETLRDSYQSETETFNSLRRLELMHLSFDVLKETEIGKVVNSLRKHSSKRVAILAKRLVRGWKELVEACCRSAVDVAAAATAVNEQEEHGLPSPPMDEAALLVAPTASVEMFQLWDLMDDVTSTGSDYHEAVDYEPRYSRTSSSKKISGSHALTKDSERGTVVSRASTTNKKDTASKELDLGIGITEEPSNLKESSTLVSAHRFDEKDELTRVSNGIHRSLNQESVEKISSSTNSVERRTEAIAPQKAQTSKPSISSSFSDEKMQATKRNLRENYEREEHAKKQRTIQVLDLNDLPKGGLGRAKNSYLIHGRPSSQIRPRTMSCR